MVDGEDRPTKASSSNAALLFGRDYIREIPRLLSQILGISNVFVGEVVYPDNQLVKALSFWAGDKYVEGYSYNMAHTPCEDVFGKTACNYPKNVQELFPEDKDLQVFGIEGYAGVPLFSISGDALGLLVALHDKKIENVEEVERTLLQHAPRVGAELENMHAFRTIKAAESRFTSVFENTRVAVAITDSGGRLIRNNEALESFLDYSPQAMLNTPFLDFSHPGDLPAEQEQQTLLLAGEITHYRLEKRYLRKDGETVWGDLSVSAVLGEDEQLANIVSVIVDLTDRKRAENEKQTALVSAEMANQAKSEFLATMSHEFRTPLNAILGFSEILRSQYLGPLGSPSYREYAEDIHTSGEHLLSLINDVLDIVALEAGKRKLNIETLDLREVLKECVRKMVPQSTEKNIDLTFDVSEQTPPLRADRRSIVQILLNLIANAISFNNAGGKVRVSTCLNDKCIQVRVEDNGYGIPPDKLTTVTEAFIQAHSNPHIAQGGMGLGLSIVKSLLDSHKGTMKIESELGKGTVVEITFPAH